MKCGPKVEQEGLRGERPVHRLPEGHCRVGPRGISSYRLGEEAPVSPGLFHCPQLGVLLPR